MSRIKCTICQRWRSTAECKLLSSSMYSWFHNYLHANGNLTKLEDLYYCKKCTSSLYRIEKDLTGVSEYISSNVLSIDIAGVSQSHSYLTLENVLYTGSSHKQCIVCRKPVASKMIVMPRGTRLDLLLIEFLLHMEYAAAHLILLMIHAFVLISI